MATVLRVVAAALLVGCGADAAAPEQTAGPEVLQLGLTLSTAVPDSVHLLRFSAAADNRSPYPVVVTVDCNRMGLVLLAKSARGEFQLAPGPCRGLPNYSLRIGPGQRVESSRGFSVDNFDRGSYQLQVAFATVDTLIRGPSVSFEVR